MSRASQLFEAIGVLFTARLLYELGYISKTEDTSVVFETKTLAEALAVYDAKLDTKLAKLIEQAHNLSHL